MNAWQFWPSENLWLVLVKKTALYRNCSFCSQTQTCQKTVFGYWGYVQGWERFRFCHIKLSLGMQSTDLAHWSFAHVNRNASVSVRTKCPHYNNMTVYTTWEHLTCSVEKKKKMFEVFICRFCLGNLKWDPHAFCLGTAVNVKVSCRLQTKTQTVNLHVCVC